MTDLSQPITAAIDDAYKAVREHFHDAADLTGYDEVILRELIHVALEAAAPHLAAAERERLIAGAAEAQTVINERQRAEAAEERLLQARARLQQARAALLEDGYFTPEQIGPDIAPRITERIAAERERCAQLAEECGAAYPVTRQDTYGGEYEAGESFADLLREQP